MQVTPLVDLHVIIEFAGASKVDILILHRVIFLPAHISSFAWVAWGFSEVRAFVLYCSSRRWRTCIYLSHHPETHTWVVMIKFIRRNKVINLSKLFFVISLSKTPFACQPWNLFQPSNEITYKCQFLKRRPLVWQPALTKQELKQLDIISSLFTVA